MLRPRIQPYRIPERIEAAPRRDSGADGVSDDVAGSVEQIVFRAKRAVMETLAPYRTMGA